MEGVWEELERNERWDWYLRNDKFTDLGIVFAVVILIVSWEELMFKTLCSFVFIRKCFQSVYIHLRGKKSPLNSTLRLQQVLIFKNYLMNSKQKRAFLFLLHFESASNESSLKNKQTNKTPNAQNRPFQKEGPPDLISQQVLRQLWPEEKQNTQGRCLAPASPDWHQSPWIGKKKDKWVTSHLVVTYSIGPRYQCGNDSQVAGMSAAQTVRKLSRPSTKSHRAACHTSRDTFSGCSTLTRCSQLSNWRTQDWVPHSRDGQVDFLALVFIFMGNEGKTRNHKHVISGFCVPFSTQI